MSPFDLHRHIADLTVQLADRPLDGKLNAWLNAEHGPGSPTFENLQATCIAGIAEGWLCNREGGGVRYGRIFKPSRVRARLAPPHPPRIQDRKSHG